MRGSNHAPAPEFQGTRCVSRDVVDGGWSGSGERWAQPRRRSWQTGEMGGKAREAKRRCRWVITSSGCACDGVFEGGSGGGQTRRAEGRVACGRVAEVGKEVSGTIVVGS